jgi:PEP-CTERM motif
VILGEFGASGPLDALSSTIGFHSDGPVQDVTFLGGACCIGGDSFSGAYSFTLYALSWVSSGSNEQTFSVDASESFSGNLATTTVATLPVTNFYVKAGDLLAFAGIGPYYPGDLDGTGNDASYSTDGEFTATPPSGAIGTTITVGNFGDRAATYQDFSGRTYDIGVDYVAPEPGTFAIMLAGLGILAGIRFHKKLSKVRPAERISRAL